MFLIYEKVTIFVKLKVTVTIKVTVLEIFDFLVTVTVTVFEKLLVTVTVTEKMELQKLRPLQLHDHTTGMKQSFCKGRCGVFCFIRQNCL